MKFKFLMLFMTLSLLSLKIIDNNACDEKSNKYLTYNKYPNTNDTHSIFSQFNSFADLRPSSNSSLNCTLIYNITNYLEFIPRVSCILDVSFWVKELFSQAQIVYINTVGITNLLGLDIHTKPIQISTKYMRRQTVLQIFSSNLEFYSYDHRIDSTSGKECNLDTYNNTFNFLNSFYIVKFYNVVYPKVMCPLVFKG